MKGWTRLNTGRAVRYTCQKCGKYIIQAPVIVHSIAGEVDERDAFSVHSEEGGCIVGGLPTFEEAVQKAEQG